MPMLGEDFLLAVDDFDDFLIQVWKWSVKSSQQISNNLWKSDV